MKYRTRLSAVAVALVVGGCGSIDVQENLVMPDGGYFPAGGVPETLWVSGTCNPDKLEQAYAQVTGGAGFRNGEMESTTASFGRPLPPSLAEQPLIVAIVRAAHEALRTDADKPLTVSRRDVELATSLFRAEFVPTGAGMNAELLGDDDKVGPLIVKYLTAYYSDEKGFVDREGTVYKVPEIKNSIGNDTITTTIAIALEAMFDELLCTPVYVDQDGNPQTTKSNKPSVLRFNEAYPTETVVKDNAPGIDSRELKAIRYLSGLAGDQSQALSGAAFRAFGGPQVSLAIGAKWSIGDNDTVAEVLDTVFEISAKRISEAIAYRRLVNWSVGDQGEVASGSSGVARLIGIIGEMDE